MITSKCISKDCIFVFFWLSCTLCACVFKLFCVYACLCEILCVFPVGQRLRVECSHVQQCGGCPRNGNQAATSPPMIRQTTRRPWSFSATLTTRPTAAWPGTPHAIDLTLQLPCSLSLFPSFAFLLVMAFISLSLSRLALSQSFAEFWLCLPSIYCSVLF